MPIPGTTNSVRLEENIGAAAIQLSDTDIRDIEAAVATDRVVGKRYQERELGNVNR